MDIIDEAWIGHVICMRAGVCVWEAYHLVHKQITQKSGFIPGLGMFGR